MIFSRYQLISRTFLGTLVLFSAYRADALPFNQEMIGKQPGYGHITRQQPEGSIAAGASERYMGTREEAVNLKNPVVADKRSISNGRRLYAANCSMCHGRFIDNKYIVGGVQTQVPGPNLSLQFYKEKPDARYFEFIHFGGMAIMPAYGWKFSIRDHWDIVNYLRDVQKNIKP